MSKSVQRTVGFLVLLLAVGQVSCGTLGSL